MKKYFIVLAIEIIIYSALILFNQISTFIHPLMYLYIIMIPVIYLILFIIDLKKMSKWYLCLISLAAIPVCLLATFIYDGRTVFQTNPDSSVFAWFIFFSYLRFIFQVCAAASISLVYFITKKIQNKIKALNN